MMNDGDWRMEDGEWRMALASPSSILHPLSSLFVHHSEFAIQELLD
jgi:hypothetical protein